MFEVPGARLHVEVRGGGPVVALVGAPMDADAFGPLAELLAGEFTVVTMDPRGIHRSVLEDPAQDSTPELRADDLARVLVDVGGGPAAVFGSSGGAVTALALAQSRPELVRLVVAHEPPVAELLPDREELRAGTEDQIATYLGGDELGAWRKFLAQGGIFMPDEVVEMVWGRDREARVLADERRWFAHELRGTTRFVPDLVALKGVAVVAGIGVESAGQVCDRTTRALAAGLGVEPVLFPGGHVGFVDDPVGFVPRLREVLGGV